MAHSLGKKVIAEGVEKQHQLDILHALECDVVQGYFIVILCHWKRPVIFRKTQ